jgi:hypothetical protein
MSSVPAHTPVKETASPTRRRHAAKAPEPTTAALREAIRAEVREEEFAGLQQCLMETTETLMAQSRHMAQQAQVLADAKSLVEQQAAALGEMHALIKGFSDNGIQIQTPDGTIAINLATGTGVLKEEAAETKPELDGDDYLVQGVFMDFIEIHGALNKAGRDRRPLFGNVVQARYSDHSEPEIHICRKGLFGTSENMFNTILTLRIHDNDPYIDGAYTDFGKTVSLSADQVKRIVGEIHKAMREELDSRNGH